VDALERHVECDDIFQRGPLDRVIPPQQVAQRVFDILGRGRRAPANFIWQALEVAHCKPARAGICRARLQLLVQLAQQRKGKLVVRLVQHQVKASEVVHRLDDVVHGNGRVRATDGFGLENQARLLVRKHAALHVVGVEREVDLHPVVDAPAYAFGPFPTQDVEQRSGARVCPDGLCRIGGNPPGFADELSARHTPLSAVIPHASL